MRRAWVVLVLMSMALLVSVTGASFAASAASSPKTETLQLKTTPIQFADLDLGAKGPSLGDEFIFSDRVKQGGKNVGTDGGVCTLTRSAGSRSQFNCVATFDLSRGQIAVQALFTVSDTVIDLAVTGGSGAFKDVGGSGTVSGPNQETVTLNLIHLD